MAKFMFLYRGGEEKKKMEDMTPEELQQVMVAWSEWIGAGMEAGWLIDAGDALKADGRVIQPDHTIVDGPFAESKELVGGYSLVEAADFAEACAHAKGSPVLAAGGVVEVRELAMVGPDPE